MVYIYRGDREVDSVVAIRRVVSNTEVRVFVVETVVDEREHLDGLPIERK